MSWRSQICLKVVLKWWCTMAEAVTNTHQHKRYASKLAYKLPSTILTKTDPGYSSMEILGFSIEVYHNHKWLGFFTPDPENNQADLVSFLTPKIHQTKNHEIHGNLTCSGDLFGMDVFSEIHLCIAKNPTSSENGPWNRETYTPPEDWKYDTPKWRHSWKEIQYIF